MIFNPLPDNLVFELPRPPAPPKKKKKKKKKNLLKALLGKGENASGPEFFPFLTSSFFHFTTAKATLPCSDIFFFICKDNSVI